MTSYVAVGWIARSFYFNNIDRDIHSRVLSGDIAIDLLRPVDFQLMHLSNALGESLFRLVLFAVPAGLVICLVYPVMPPVDSLALVGFAVATWLAFLINGQINFMIGLIAFKTRSVMGIMRVKHIAMQLLTGLIVPISFFPETLRTLLYLTPFPYIANVPLEVYLGKISSTQFYSAIGIQLMWIISLFFLGRLLWRNSLRALVIQGG